MSVTVCLSHAGLPCLLDKFDAAQVKVISCIGVQDALIVNAAWCDGHVPIQLRAAKYEGHELIVI